VQGLSSGPSAISAVSYSRAIMACICRDWRGAAPKYRRGASATGSPLKIVTRCTMLLAMVTALVESPACRRGATAGCDGARRAGAQRTHFQSQLPDRGSVLEWRRLASRTLHPRAVGHQTGLCKRARRREKSKNRGHGVLSGYATQQPRAVYAYDRPIVLFLITVKKAC
jgi:hypothetical protein